MIMPNKQRNATLDIAKGLCIILLTVSHGGCPNGFRSFILMFYIPCFFVISGWLFSDKYLDDLKKGLWHKAWGIYKTFVKWELIFLALHNIFALCGIYTESYSISEIASKAVRIVLMSGGEQLVGGFWFLISLFWATIFSMTYLYVLKLKNKLTLIYILGGVIGALLINIMEHFIPFHYPDQFGPQTMLATAFYLSGYACKKQKITIEGSWIKVIGFWLLPLVLSFFFTWRLTSGLDIYAVIPFYLTACVGTLGMLQFCACLSRNKSLTLVLTYVGERTLYVLTFHFLGFKLMSLLYICFTGSTMNHLADFPVMSIVPSWFWICYAIGGLLFSLLMHKLLSRYI
jgi:fucose 4-O-acetylase-like acetyltransferase